MLYKNVCLPFSSSSCNSEHGNDENVYFTKAKKAKCLHESNNIFCYTKNYNFNILYLCFIETSSFIRFSSVSDT